MIEFLGMWYEIIEWIGGFLVAVGGIPRLIRTIKDGHARGLEWSFIKLWFGGEIFSFIYLLPTDNLPMVINLGVNTIFTAIIIYYKKYEREPL